jgi:hypothetical protein
LDGLRLWCKHDGHDGRPPADKFQFRFLIQDIDFPNDWLSSAERNLTRTKSGFFEAKAELAAILRGYGGAPARKEHSVLEFRRTALQEHKFRIGQTVYFTSRPIGHMAANSTYEVVKLLPSDGADYQYRIKNSNEAFERVARESQLEFMG